MTLEGAEAAPKGAASLLTTVEWLWSLALLVLLLGPVAWALVSGRRRKPPESPTHQELETYQERFINWPKRGPFGRG